MKAVTTLYVYIVGVKVIADEIISTFCHIIRYLKTFSRERRENAMNLKDLGRWSFA